MKSLFRHNGNDGYVLVTRFFAFTNIMFYITLPRLYQYSHGFAIFFGVDIHDEVIVDGVFDLYGPAFGAELLGGVVVPVAVKNATFGYIGQGAVALLVTEGTAFFGEVEEFDGGLAGLDGDRFE